VCSYSATQLDMDSDESHIKYKVSLLGIMKPESQLDRNNIEGSVHISEDPRKMGILYNGAIFKHCLSLVKETAGCLARECKGQPVNSLVLPTTTPADGLIEIIVIPWCSGADCMDEIRETTSFGMMIPKIEHSPQIFQSVGKVAPAIGDTFTTFSFCALCFGVVEKKPEGGGGMKRCSACKKVYYCDKNCQKNHWAQHKFVCSLLNQ